MVGPTTPAEVEVLYFDGCPNHDRLLPLVREMATRYGVELRLRQITSVEQAERERFLGSPSVRVNGVDVEPGAEQRDDYGLNCRLYRADGARDGLPASEWIEVALRAVGRGH